MARIEAIEGVEVRINNFAMNLDINGLPDQTVMDLLNEARQVAEDRGLLDEAENLGSIAVTGTREEPEVEVATALVTPKMLHATLGESAPWYTKVVTGLNDGRPKRKKFQVVPEDELPGRAEEWLTAERVQAAEDGLSYLDDKPLILMPVPNVSVSHEEILGTWSSARNGRLYQWSGQLAFLKQWSADSLSGYKSTNSLKLVRFVVIETGYGPVNRGNRNEQLELLQGIQSRHPEVRSASLFEGGILANRYSDEPSPDWRDTYVRAIEVDPDSVGCVPSAFVDDGGGAGVLSSHVDGGAVSRRLVG